MVLLFTSVMLSLTLLQPAMSQIGELASFGETANDLAFSKMTSTPNVKTYNGHSSILWNLTKSFPAFEKNRTQIRVRT